MGLYGERVGAISFVCENQEEKERVDSQLKIIIRPLYSNPPVQYVSTRNEQDHALSGGILIWCIAVLVWLAPFSVTRHCTMSGEFTCSHLPKIGGKLTCSRLVEVKGMADRIISMRDKLYNKLVELNTPGEWGHIKSQIGQLPSSRGSAESCRQ